MMMDNSIDDYLIFSKCLDEQMFSGVDNDLDGLLMLFAEPSRDLMFLSDDSNSRVAFELDCDLDLSLPAHTTFSANEFELAADCLRFDNFTEQDFDYLLRDNCNASDAVDLLPKYDSNTDQQHIAANLYDLFPHIADEKNARRRSLLFETNATIPMAAHHQRSKHQQQNAPAALIVHDYAQRQRDEDKCFACPLPNCEKIYAKSTHLKAHLRRHSGEKPFVCNWANCNWKFSRSDELARHKRSHSGVKPYKCTLCEKAFARSDHLSKHNKVHRKKMAQYGSYIIKKRLRNNGNNLQQAD